MKIQNTQSQPSFKALVIKNKLTPETLKQVGNLTEKNGFRALFGQTFFGGDRICINTKLGTREESQLKVDLAAVLGDKNPIVYAPAEIARKLVGRFCVCNCKSLEKWGCEVFK